MRALNAMNEDNGIKNLPNENPDKFCILYVDAPKMGVAGLTYALMSKRVVMLSAAA